MNTTSSIYLLLAMLWANVSFAQLSETPSPKTSSIHIHIGTANVLVRDRSFSPLSFSGNTVAFSIGYEKVTKEYLRAFNFKTNIGPLAYNNYFQTNQSEFKLSAGYAKKLPYRHLQTQSFLGAKIHAASGVLDYNEFDNGSWFSSVGLDVFYVSERRLNNKHSVGVKFSHPILAYAVRPPYAGFDAYISDRAADGNLPSILFSKGVMTTGFSFINPVLQFDYAYKLSAKIDISARYTFNYLHYRPSIKTRNSRTISSYKNSFLVGFKYKL